MMNETNSISPHFLLLIVVDLFALFIMSLSSAMNNNENIFVNGKRTSSRVTEEPGGKSSVQLSWESSPEPKQKKEKFSNDSNTTFQPNFARRVTVSSNAYANGHSQNTGNVLTDRPTSKVTQPPGGRSSITFG